ncbi:unnamed protein product, partial [Vitis vinifera]
MHNGDIDLNEYSLQDLLGLASSASVDRSSVQAANRPPALKPSVSEALSRSIHTANRPLVLKTSASEAQNRNFHVANGPLVRKATTGEAPERSLLNASRPQVPNSHSQFEINWGEDNSIDMLLGKENQCSGSSMWKNSNGLLQIPEYGFPIPYQPSFNLNSPPGVEADATSSITNSFPCPPVTPERPKKILNFSADEGSSPDKNQEYITSTTNGATENRCDELLHNIVASSSAAPPSPCKGKNIVAKEGDEGIDLNKTPKQKQPKKRKHRPKVVIEGKPKKTPKPKVVIEGKPKKTPKPKVPSNSNPKENPTGKRKYVRKNNPKVPVTDPTDVRKEILDPSFASATAKSCKRVLNFGEEKSGDGQHDVASQQGVMQQDNEPTFTLNLTSQTKEPCTRINIISGTKVAMQNDQQNELVVKSQQMSAVESQQISADYIAMLKRYTPAAQPTTENLQLGNLNVISRTVNKGNTDPRQRNSKNAYVPIPQHIHADGIGQIVIQPLTTQENLDSSRRQMMQSTSQTNKFANSNQATGSKRDYCHTIEQSQAHAAHLIGPSLCQEIFQVNEYNSSNLCKVFSDMQKKRKTEKAAYTNMSTMASYTTAGEDELHQAEAKSVNQLTSQINHGILNICFEGNNDSQNLANGVNKTTRDSSMHQTTAGNSMWKHHISNEWPSQTEDMREKQVNGCTQLHRLTVLTAAAKDKLQPPAPIKARSYSSGQHSIESCRVITLAEKQKEPLFSNSHSSSTYKPFLQEPKDKLYDYHQPSIKKRGRPAKKKQPDPIDAIIERLKSLELNDTSNETVSQEENAIILYKGDGAIIPYEIKKRKPRPKVDLDLETERVWKLLMGAEQDVGDSDERKAKWWEEEREVFRGRADSFIARMHLVQGDRRFSPWKGSVVDSVIGVFLTQNVSDHLSSSAFMSLVSRFPLHPESNKTSYSNEASILVEEPEVCIMNPDDTIKWHEKVSHQQEHLTREQRKKSSSASTNILYMEKTFMSQECQYHANKSSNFDENTMRYRKQNPRLDRVENHTESSSLTYLINSGNSNKQAPAVPSSNYRLHMTPDSGILEVEYSAEKVEGTKKKAFDWDSLRKQVQANGRKRERSKDTMDSLDYEAIRCAHVNVISEAIKERGMNNMLAERIKDFLNRLVREHGSIDLEWLRDSPPDKAKDYLLSIRGLGLKSVECVRLLTLHQLAFPVDTNVGRIAVRLGWVPLQPLPESLQLHLLELYPMLESIQKYLWPRLCKLDQRTLYELHYQLITFGKVFCTKHKPNCNACPMRGECRHFASAFASARLALPAPEEKSIVSSTAPSVADRNPTAFINPIPLPSLESNLLGKEEQDTSKCEPIIEVPATPEPQCIETLESDIEDAFYEDPDEIPTIKLNFEEFTLNLQNYMQENMELQEGDMSKALVALDPKATSIPTPKLKNVSRLRTEHQVYELPDSHPLLKGMDIREPDDPSPYLLAIWTPGETANSSQPPERRCESQEPGKLCNEKTCFSCNSLREANSQTVRGTLLIPCRTAMRGSFPLNGTYFQVNEVFADHDSSINPIDVPRAWIWNLPRRTVYFGTSVTSIFRGLPTEGIQYCFWRGFVCVRGFDQKSRAPRPLMARLHLSANKLSKTKNENN